MYIASIVINKENASLFRTKKIARRAMSATKKVPTILVDIL